MKRSHRIGKIGGLGKLTLLKLAVAALGILYSIIQVRIFGTSLEIENYFAATTLIYMLLSFAQTGQLAEIFLPVYLGIKARHGVTEAHRAFSVVVNKLLVGVFAVSIIGLVTSPFIVKILVPGFEHEQHSNVVRFFIASLPSIVLTVINSFFSSLLNAERRFGKSEISSVFSLITSLAILLSFSDRIGPWVLIISLYVGQVIEFVTSVLFIKGAKIKYSLIFSTPSFNHNRFFSNLRSTSLYVVCSQVFTIALTSSISFLPQGVFAVYRYSLQIFERAFGILIMPLTTLFFTRVAELVAVQDINAVKQNVRENLQYGILISAITLIIVIAAGYDAITLMWMTKNFSAESVVLAYQFMVLWFTIFVVQAVSMVFRRTAVALDLASKQYALSALAMVLSAVATYIAVRNFGMSGLFVSLVISRVLLFGVPPLVVFVFKRDLFSFPRVGFCAKLLLVMALTLVGGYFFNEFVSNLFNDVIYRHIASCIASFVASIFLFLIFSYFLGLEKVVLLFTVIGKRL